jgi:hypothetical protein
MQQLIRRKARSRVAGALQYAAAALMCIAALGWPNLSNAAPHGGGGGFHGGGFGGFHGGGFHEFGGGWHGGVAGGNWHGGNWYHGWHNGRYGWWWGGAGPGLGFTYYNYPFDWGYWPDSGYFGDYGYGQQPYAGQYWYYCSDPSGYYPYVAQCNVPWQPVPPT